MIDLNEILTQLSQQRQIFHSEADFQYALAWEIQKRLPNVNVRLEYPINTHSSRLHLDIYVTQCEQFAAIELKYKTRKISVQVGQEKFSLKNQSAQDHGRYDFIKDISRLEQLQATHKNGAGYAILLTNDSAYWKTPRTGQTVDANFRLHQGRTLHGTLNWQGGSAGTLRGRESSLTLEGHYALQWQDYSELSSMRYGAFRYLLVSTP